MHHYVSAEEAISIVKSGDRVFLHGSACTPNVLIDEMARQADRLRNVEVVSITQQGNMEIAKPQYKDSFYIKSLFVSTPVREAVNCGRGDFVPVFLSEIPLLFKNKVLPLDVAIVTVSPPDVHGYCTLGTSIDVARSAIDSAKSIIAVVNPKMPRTHGDGMIHVQRIDKMIWHEEELLTIDYGSKVTDVERQIGKNVAELIDDRSTLQMGIGTIPDAVLQCLANHKDLGIHTEMLSDGVIDLIKNDVINNKYKGAHENRTITSFCFGTKRLYDFINDNPSIAFLDVLKVNHPIEIMKNQKMTAINSAIEVDLTGQVCADSIGTYQFSGIGGQMDFMRGAALSEGGKPIIAISSRTKKGVPRIVPLLKPGAGVVTTRGHIHYVITEYGTAYLYGKSLRERAKALIEIAHPDDREMLDKAAFERFKVEL
ncbi:acetyl-CoA hydrolase/transferase family protein [Riemerella anatipestifer]|uniref:Acetyl-CoA hydrolase/transferase n=1 Tax=Riemerella anatipestifer (strain ATCC 11845 / DSM 15868 / JCM 9532 / NCTC 11014) TaxID=693978 RepID=E4TD43_RIEAD|nr:acetyl-CoA hydrolase/transferase C-terminal domain-containing protein [Riemerella anatipestifer]ADQ82702.1 acetyl-CoA hydrolase/transferase [Riemerella anatipestifer ATCC 11845 = DSM 15868]ADZ11806.1 Acetyl-CoA hydrolase [Riemerella anatipestifer RA-GD]AFD56711.1 acetyl-CoA hydrolase/transferase [Riemerella anatipestifer ATCC 11845 = DSM 15868]AGC39309.1 Acetyl-CoA hydrolase [Riemerella anatipestifer RA-CH-2]AKP69879.1 acetyl-CoA hydrolase/transferase [Riemerella anatipestifer]